MINSPVFTPEVFDHVYSRNGPFSDYFCMFIEGHGWVKINTEEPGVKLIANRSTIVGERNLRG